MAKIEDVFKLASQSDVITELKSKRLTPQPDKSKAEKQLNPLDHDVHDHVLRPDKKVKIDLEDGGNTTVVSGSGDQSETRIEKVNRVAVALQKLIVKRAVAFLFGNEVTLNAQAVTEKEKQVYEAVKKILAKNKAGSLNRKVARQAFSTKEVAELWFPVPVDKTNTGKKVKDFVNNIIGNNFHTEYGFKSKFKLRSAVFSPLYGDTLFPYFDETGDLIAFSREYQRTDQNNVSRQFFETWTDTMHVLWEMKTQEWEVVEGYPRTLINGKIPVVYGPVDYYEWEDVQGLIDRLEKLLSNFADIIDYHAAPKIFTTGDIKGFGKKGEAGMIIEAEENATAEYLAWEFAPDAVKLEIETLLKLIYTISQTPDISFESVKGVGALSGIALKLLFLDAHLKVKDHQEVFDEYMQRRINVIKSFVAKFNTALEVECFTLDISPEITPFMIEDELSLVTLLTTANGNKPLVSQKLSAKLSNLAVDSEADFTQMEKEAKTDNTFNIGEPTV